MPSPEKIAYDPHAPVDPRVETLVNELIGRVADKWTLLVLEELEDPGTCRFTQLSRLVPGISQKMLTQTLDRKSVGLGKQVAVSVGFGCRRLITAQIVRYILYIDI